MNDNELHVLIKQAHPRLVIPHSFQREVWMRIAIAEQQSWSAQWRQRLRHLFSWIAQPLPATVMVTTMLVTGAGLGNLTAPRDASDAQRSAYIASINPMISTHN